MEEKNVELLRDAVIKTLEAKLPEAAKNAAEEAVKLQIESAVQRAADLAVQRSLTGKDLTGLTLESKMKFVADVKTLLLEGNRAKSLIDTYQDNIGGVLLPVETANAILRLTESVGIVAAQATKIPMGGVDQIIVPRYTGSVLAGGYSGQGIVGTSESVTFGDATLKKHTWQTLFRVGNGMFKNANANVADFLLSLVAEGLAYQMELQAFVGTGAPFVGILNETGVTTVVMGGATNSGKDTFAEIAYSDLVDLQTAVKPSALNDACYFMHRTVWGLIKKLTDDAGTPLQATSVQITKDMINSDPAIRPIGFIDSFPVYATEVLPAASATAVTTDFIVFGSMKHLLLGDGGEMTMAKSDSATLDSVNVFASNQSALRWTHDHAISVGLPAAFAKLRTSTT